MQTPTQRIKIERCPCHFPSCSDYHLVGFGKFVQGSGFKQDEAELVASLINKHFEGIAIREIQERQL